MAIIRWNPWNLSDFLENDWDLPTFPGSSKLGQGLNIYETDESIVAQAALPGVPEENVDVTVDNNTVRISASANEEKVEKEKRRYYMNSISRTYNYSFKLPDESIKKEEPEVDLSDGVLTIIFPKIEKIPPKKIQVKTKK